MCLQALIVPPWGQKYYVVYDTCIHICNMCCVFFTGLDAQKITTYIHVETSARQCQVTTVRMYVDHYVFIIHEINMYYHRCMHVCLHVYRLYVYLCATVHVWVHVRVCVCAIVRVCVCV